MSHIEVVRNLRFSESDELNIMPQHQADNVVEVSIIETDYDGPLNEGFYLDPNDSEDKDMLNYLEILFKKQVTLNNLNKKSERFFKIIQVKDVLNKLNEFLI